MSVAGNVVKGTDGVTLYLDAFDNVVYVEAKYLANYQYGLIIKKYFNEFDDAISVKLLTREGKIETVAFAQRTVVDGSTCKSANLINNALNAVGEIAIDGTDLPSGVFPVRYKLNDNMEIYALDTPKRGDFEDEYSMTLMSQGRHVYSSDGVLGFRVPLNSGTTVLRVDTDTGFDNFSYYLEESRYAFVGNNSFASGTAYQYSAYSIDPNSPYADFVLTFSSPWTNYDTFVCVVDKITQTYDEVTGEVLYRLTGMVRGTEVKVPISKEYEQTFLDMKLVRGDVIRYATNLVGHICMIDDDRAVVKYDKDTGTMKFNNVREGKTSISNFDSANYSTVAMMGEVRSREEGLIQYHYIEWETSFDIDRPYAEATESTLMCAPIGGGVPVTVYDAKDDRIYAGTYDDIVAIDSNFSEHSKVLLRYRSSRLQEVVVFNDRSLGK